MKKHAHPQKEAGRDHGNQGTELMQELYDYILNETLKKSSIFFKLKELFDKLNRKIVPIPLKTFSKIPAIDGWTEDSYNPSLFSWARHYGNAGIIPGRNDLLVFDCDSTETIQFFEELAKKVNLNLNTLVIQTRKGRHYYYYCEFSKELERKQFHNDQIKLDILAGSRCQVVAPFSQLKIDESGNVLDPKAENYIIFEYIPINIPERIAEITHEQYETIIKKLNKQFKKTQREIQRTTELQERELTDEEIEKLYEIISEYFEEGVRQNLILYLAGYLRKTLKISEESIYRLYEKFISIDDPDDIKARFAAIKKTYEKNHDVISGWQGLVKVLGEETAEELVNKTCEALNIEHYKAKKHIFIEFSEKKYIKIDNDRKVIELGKFDKEGNFIRLHRVFVCVFEIYMLKNLLSQETFKYEFRCISNHPIEKEFVARGNLQEIWEQIYANTSYVETPSIGEIVLKKVSNYYFEKGWYEEKLEELPPGFYYAKENNIEFIFASQFENEYSKEELVKAARLLDEYVSSHPTPQIISSVIKAGLLLPFSFIQKQRGSKDLIRWLYLYGATRTGKTTTAKVLQAIWNYEYITNWASFCTEARLAKHLSNSTFPILVDEVGETIENHSITLMLKMAFEEQNARQIQTKTNRTITFSALASIIMTSNTYFPHDPALLNRFFVFHFHKNAQIRPEDRKKYSRHDLFKTLPPIGKFVWDYIIQHGWKDNYIEYATEILKALFLETLNKIPDWVEMQFITSNEETEEEQETEREAILYSAILNFLHSKVRPEDKKGKYQFARSVFLDLVDRKFGFIYSDGWDVYITKELLFTCKKYSPSFNFKTLADVAEVTNWEKVRKKVRGKVTWVLKTDIIDFLYKLGLIPKRLSKSEFEQFVSGIDVDTINEEGLPF